MSHRCAFCRRHFSRGASKFRMCKECRPYFINNPRLALDSTAYTPTHTPTVVDCEVTTVTSTGPTGGAVMAVRQAPPSHQQQQIYSSQLAQQQQAARPVQVAVHQQTMAYYTRDAAEAPLDRTKGHRNAYTMVVPVYDPSQPQQAATYMQFEAAAAQQQQPPPPPPRQLAYYAQAPPPQMGYPAAYAQPMPPGVAYYHPPPGVPYPSMPPGMVPMPQQLAPGTPVYYQPTYHPQMQPPPGGGYPYPEAPAQEPTPSTATNQ